jgi:glycosyltransferase involved in cell wall biosynthesis
MTSHVEHRRKAEDVQNFGDFLAELLLDELFYPLGIPTRRTHLIGSLVSEPFVESRPDQPVAPVGFWGRAPREPGSLSTSRLREATSFRGPISTAELTASPEVPVAEPALVLPALYRPTPEPSLLGRTVCIPHFHDERSDETLRRMSGCDVVLRPRIANDGFELRRFIDALVSADFVLSASLHGAVVAAAYRRPFAFWDNGAIDQPFEWRDLAALLQIPVTFVQRIDAARALYASAIKPAIRLPSMWSSLATAPLLLRPSGLLRMFRHQLADRLEPAVLKEIDSLIGVFEECRGHDERLLAAIEDEHRQLRAGVEQAATAAREAARLESEAADRDRDLLRRQVRDLAQQVKLARLRAEVQAGKAVQSRNDLDATRQETRQLHAEIAALRAHFIGAEATIKEIRRSTSWRVTWPLRWMSTRVPGVSRASRAIGSLLPGKQAQPGGVSPVATNIATGTPTQSRSGGSIAAGHPPSAKLAAQKVGAKGPLDWLGLVVLIIDASYPRPDEDAGSLHAVQYVRMFQALGYQVAFIATAEFAAANAARTELSAMGVYCVTADEYESVESFLQVSGPALDVCVLSRSHCGGHYIEEVRRRCPGAKVIFNTVDLHYLREEREALLRDDRRALNIAWKTREREYAVARLSDATTVVSEQEAILLGEAIPGTCVEVISLVQTSPGRKRPFAHRSGIGFIGGFRHQPNVDAVRFFLDEIWPDLRTRLPEVVFYIIGPHLPESLRDGSDPRVIGVGHVPDLSTRLEELRVTVAPLRFGAGAKGKIVSSLGHGVPCVATSIAVEGMALGDVVVAADTPQQFCDAVVALHEDERQWLARSDAGIAMVAERHGLDAACSRLAQLLSTINAPVRR